MNSILSKDVIKEWGLAAMPQKDQNAIVERIGRILYQAILVRALDILSEKEQTEFDELLDNDLTTPDDVLAFLQKKIPTFEKMVEDEKKSLKEDILIPAR
jgi:hypothetical protein